MLGRRAADRHCHDLVRLYQTFRKHCYLKLVRDRHPVVPSAIRLNRTRQGPQQQDTASADTPFIILCRLGNFTEWIGFPGT